MRHSNELALPHWAVDGMRAGRIKLLLVPVAKQPPASHTQVFKLEDNCVLFITPAAAGPMRRFPEKGYASSPLGQPGDRKAVRPKGIGKARVVITVTHVRVARVQEFSEVEIFESGVFAHPRATTDGGPVYVTAEFGPVSWSADPLAAFSAQWNYDHARRKPELRFEANPWTWAYRLEVTPCKD